MTAQITWPSMSAEEDRKHWEKVIQAKVPKATGTRVIRSGSGSRCVEVMIEGIPATGLIDTGSDITIIRGDLFIIYVVATAHLEIQSLKSAEQKAYL